MLRPTSPTLAIVVADGPRWDLRLRRVSTALAIGLGRHSRAGFQQRLEIAEDPRPAAAALGRIATGLQLVFDAAAIGVALGPFGLGDRIPDRMGAGLYDDPVNQNGRCFVRHGHLSLSSSSALSARSAETSRSLYLSIHRS